MGVAPKAYIGSYKVLSSSGSTSDVIAKAIDDAVADGMDVLNISLGAYVTSFSEVAPTEIGIAAIEAAVPAESVAGPCPDCQMPPSSPVGVELQNAFSCRDWASKAHIAPRFPSPPNAM